MVRGLESVLLHSEDPKSLANFYQDKIGIEIKEEYDMGEGASAFEMNAGDGSSFMINSHSEIKGKAQDPNRILLNFEVKNIEEAVKEVSDRGVKVVQDTYHIEGYGYIATFEDIDGNYFQLVQVRDDED
jgi:predicted enzyme related to lactoylglutathione lyase